MTVYLYILIEIKFTKMEIEHWGKKQVTKHYVQYNLFLVINITNVIISGFYFCSSACYYFFAVYIVHL